MNPMESYRSPFSVSPKMIAVRSEISSATKFELALLNALFISELSVIKKKTQFE